MNLLIGVATYRRTTKLERLLQSLHDGTYQNFRVEIVADNKDLETLIYLQKKLWFNDKKYLGLVQDTHKYVIGAWNRVVQENIHRPWDGFIGLCDDVQLEPNALENIVKSHQFHFPDTDGVCGFNQKCPGYPGYTFKWFGQTLMGRKFVERYKQGEYKICCPDYQHFYQDEEMHQFASSLGKFVNCTDSVLKHYHPGFVKHEMDETHDIIRKGDQCPKDHDFIMNFHRKDQGLIWGQDFKLISEGK